MPRPCRDDHPPSPESCPLCWLDAYRADYRDLWGEDGRRRQAPCRHLGPPTGELVLCPSCCGHVELKLFACAAHGCCTLGRAAPGVACCNGCPTYDPAEAG